MPFLVIAPSLPIPAMTFFKYNGTRSVPTTLSFLPRVLPPRLRSSPANSNLLPLWCFQRSRHTECAYFVIAPSFPGPANRDRKYNGTRSVPTIGDREALFSQTSFIDLFPAAKSHSWFPFAAESKYQPLP